MSKKKVDLNILTFFCPNKQRHTLVYCRGNITVLQQEVSGHSAADSSRHSAMSDEEYYEEEEGEEEEYEEEEYEEEEEEEEEKTIPDE